MFFPLFVVSLLLLANQSAAAQGISYTYDKAEMAAALKDAKRTLPLFLETFAKRAADSFFVKVRLACPGPEKAEYIWVGDIEVVGQEFVGLYANDAVCRKDIREGSALRFKREDIVDWLFMRDGKMHGSYSTRVTLKDMPRDDAEKVRKILAPLPD